MNTKSLSPSERKRLTESQIIKLGTTFMAALRKADPFADQAQDLIENSWDELKGRLEVANVFAINQVLNDRDVFTFRVKVPRWRTVRAIFADTKCWHKKIDKKTDDEAPYVTTMGEEEVTFVFFQIHGEIRHDQVEAERSKRGLVRDLAAQAQVNADNPTFADDHWNADVWRDKDGVWCDAYFYNDDTGYGRTVYVGQSACVYFGTGRWFGGVVPK
ncbi:MAG: hypothetical protein WC794_04680 [Candidatus Doudnabacteria bacterium]